MSRLRRFTRDVRQLARAIRRGASDVSYDELRRSEGLYRLLAENARDIIWLLDFPNQTRYVSPACETLLGWSPAQQLERREGVGMLTDASAERAGRLLANAFASGATSVTYEAEHKRADGSTVWCEVHQGIIYDEQGRPASSVGVTRDISEKRRLQEQLLQAQKTEAIGALAGGIAHDFNNFLTVIIGSLELADDELDKDEPTSVLLRDALDAAERSAALTGQLLGFSRHQPTAIEVLDINDLVRRNDSILRRVIGERIRLEVALSRNLSHARADENQIHQILVNLVMNARDAIEADGCITIETGNVIIDNELAEAQPGLVPGRYVMVAVSDDGKGMDAAVRRQATAPFFSTKAKGRGTGLGLAMVRSILERIGGDLSIYSEPQTGTTVKVYLPAVAAGAERPLVPAIELAEALRGNESILIVEDEDSVRSVAVKILRQAGYTTREAATPAQAIELMQGLAASANGPDLVLTDLVMPGMTGTLLATRLQKDHPALRFVIMSGYAENGASNLAREALPGPLVTKPFHAVELLRAVRTALGEPKA